MHKFRSILGQITTPLVVIVLVAVAFWLVGRQVQHGSPPTAQDANRPTLPSTTGPPPSSTPQATVTPRQYGVHIGKGSFVTLEPPPSPTPTPTFEPLTGQAIGGYVFSQARLVPGTVPYGIELLEWLPDAPDKILIIRDGISLEVLDSQTGAVQPYYQGQTLLTAAVWLPVPQVAAYLVSDAQEHLTQYLQVSQGQSQERVSPSPFPFTTTLSPLAVAPDGQGVIVFDANGQLIRIGLGQEQAIKPAASMAAYTPTGYNQGERYQVAQAPDRTKAIYFNNDWLLLVDFTTGKTTPLDLNALKTDAMPPLTQVQVTTWSPEGDKIAFLIAAGGMRAGNNLFVLDLQAEDMRFVEDKFHDVDNIAWAPDNQQIMMLAVTGTREGYSTGGLFLIDTISKELEPVAALPDDALIGSPRNLSWSMDGQAIVVRFADQPRNSGTYRIDVKQVGQ